MEKQLSYFDNLEDNILYNATKDSSNIQQKLVHAFIRRNPAGKCHFT